MMSALGVIAVIIACAWALYVSDKQINEKD